MLLTLLPKKSKAMATRRGSSRRRRPDEESSDSESLPAQVGRPQAPRQRVVAAGMRGPLPPPSILQGYDRVVPGAAERIIAMAERQSSHRQAVEGKLVEAQIADGKIERSERKLGQILGFTIGVIAIFSGAVIAVLGAEIAGGVIGGGTVAGLVSVFIYGHWRQLPKTIEPSGASLPERVRGRLKSSDPTRPEPSPDSNAPERGSQAT